MHSAILGMSVALLVSDQNPDVKGRGAGTGWPPEGATFPVRECLSVVLNEEWQHRRFAERDLAGGWSPG